MVICDIGAFRRTPPVVDQRIRRFSGYTQTIGRNGIFFEIRDPVFDICGSFPIRPVKDIYGEMNGFVGMVYIIHLIGKQPYFSRFKEELPVRFEKSKAFYEALLDLAASIIIYGKPAVIQE